MISARVLLVTVLLSGTALVPVTVAYGQNSGARHQQLLSLRNATTWEQTDARDLYLVPELHLERMGPVSGREGTSASSSRGPLLYGGMWHSRRIGESQEQTGRSGEAGESFGEAAGSVSAAEAGMDSGVAEFGPQASEEENRAEPSLLQRVLSGSVATDAGSGLTERDAQRPRLEPGRLPESLEAPASNPAPGPQMAAVTIALPGAQLAQGGPASLPSAFEQGNNDIPELGVPTLGGEISFTVELPGGAQAPTGSDELYLTLGDISLEGNQTYDDETLRQYWQDYVGQEISLTQVFDIAKAIENRYREDGYFLSFTYLPPQTLDEDKIRIAVVEGYIDKVIVQGVSPDVRESLEESLQSIADSRPADQRDIVRGLLAVNDMPGISATGVLKPSGETPGASDLVVSASLKRFGLTAQVDNRGSRYAGPWKWNTGGNVNSLFAAGDSLAFNVSMARVLEEQVAMNGAYRFPLNADGTTATLSAAWSQSRPGFSLRPQDIITKSWTLSAQVSHPIVRSREHNLTLTGDFTIKNIKTDLLNERQSRDAIRSVGLKLGYGQSGFLGSVSSVQLGVVQGIPGIGATDVQAFNAAVPASYPSRPDGAQHFTKTTFNALHLQPIYGGLRAMLTASAQFSFAPLLASEEYSVGGDRLGRGYDSGEISGEHGAALGVELRYSQPIGEYLVESVEPYMFYDNGVTWQMDTDFTEGDRQTLSSGGIGLRTRFDYGLGFDFEYAQPITRPVSTTKDRRLNSRYFFTFKAKY